MAFDIPTNIERDLEEYVAGERITVAEAAAKIKSFVSVNGDMFRQIAEKNKSKRIYFSNCCGRGACGTGFNVPKRRKPHLAVRPS